MKKKGFTLIEVVIAMSILVVIVGVLYKALGSSNKMMKKGTISLNAVRNTRMVIFKLFFDLQQSKEILKPQPGETTNYVLYKNSTDDLLYICKNDDDILIKKNTKYSIEEKLVKNIKSIYFTNTDNKRLTINLTVYGSKKDGKYLGMFSLIDEISLLNFTDY